MIKLSKDGETEKFHGLQDTLGIGQPASVFADKDAIDLGGEAR